jgi:DNA-binding MarR family transcriptional regulator
MFVTDAEYRSLAELRFRLRSFLAFSEAQAKAAGLEPQQHQLLLALKGFDPSRAATIGAIAERLVIRHNTAVELVGRLEKRGLVARTRSKEDRREARIRVTARGERVLRKLSVSHRDELRRSGPELIRALEGILP